MLYYHIDNNNNNIISGPHSINSVYIKKLTRCGTPERLDLKTFNLLPEVRESLIENQKYGDRIIEEERVYIPAIDKTPEEIQVEIDNERETMECTRLQARLALIQFGLWNAVNSYFSDINNRTDVELAFWEDAQIWKRSDNTLINAGSSLGLSESDIDELFVLAKTL
jgi:hypothetical protein